MHPGDDFAFALYRRRRDLERPEFRGSIDSLFRESEGPTLAAELIAGCLDDRDFVADELDAAIDLARAGYLRGTSEALLARLLQYQREQRVSA